MAWEFVRRCVVQLTCSQDLVVVERLAFILKATVCHTQEVIYVIQSVDHVMFKDQWGRLENKAWNHCNKIQTKLKVAVKIVITQLIEQNKRNTFPVCSH